MKLTNALKTKSRLAGELVRLQNIFRRENSRRNDNPSKENAGEIWNQIVAMSEKLGELKAKIAAANVPIYPKIERMAELKSRIAYLHALPVREGEELVVQYGSEPLKYNWTAFLNQQAIDAHVHTLQDQINLLQDEIDAFNATTDLTE